MTTTDQLADIVRRVQAEMPLPERFEDADKATQNQVMRQAIAQGVPASKLYADMLASQELAVQTASNSAEAAAIAKAARERG